MKGIIIAVNKPIYIAILFVSAKAAFGFPAFPECSHRIGSRTLPKSARKFIPYSIKAKAKEKSPKSLNER